MKTFMTAMTVIAMFAAPAFASTEKTKKLYYNAKDTYAEDVCGQRLDAAELKIKKLQQLLAEATVKPKKPVNQNK